MNKTLYAVSRGSYSDYGVVAIFDDKEKAESFRNWASAFDNNINTDLEEFELNPCTVAIRKGFKLFLVDMSRDGNAPRVEEWPYYQPQTIELKQYTRGPRILQGIVYAKDGPHAVKIVNEKRAQLIASGEWAK